jgi:hypothetical protein
MDKKTLDRLENGTRYRPQMLNRPGSNRLQITAFSTVAIQSFPGHHQVLILHEI